MAFQNPQSQRAHADGLVLLLTAHVLDRPFDASHTKKI